MKTQFKIIRFWIGANVNQIFTVWFLVWLSFQLFRAFFN